MTVDISTLAVGIDLPQAFKVTKDLDALGGASRRAVQETTTLAGAAKNLSDVLASLSIINSFKSLGQAMREFEKPRAAIDASVRNWGNPVVVPKSLGPEPEPIATELLRVQRAGKTEVSQEKALEYAQGLKTESDTAKAQKIDDPLAKGNALLEIEADVWRRRIELVEKSTAARTLLEQQYLAWYRNEQKKVTEAVEAEKVQKSKDSMQKMVEGTTEFSTLMTNAFGAVGKAIGGMGTALTDYNATQKKIADELASESKDPNNTEAVEKAKVKAAKQTAAAQVKSYADVASASKGFFKENSKGYKAMEAAEKAYHAVETAMAIEAALTKSGLVTSFTALFTASKVNEMTATSATVPATVAAENTKQTALANTAIAGAIAVPFPGNLAAIGIVVAMLASIGLGSGGAAGGKSLSQQRQESQGTGSVFGDSGAKSDSIAKSLELAATNSSIELSHTAGMLASLRMIESALGGLGNLLISGTGITSLAKGVGSSSSGGFFGGMISSIFGGKTTVLDTGVMIGSGTLGSIASGGVHSESYADTKKSGGWFSSDKYRTSTAALGTKIDDQFGKVILGLAGSVNAAADLLGLGGASFASHLDQFVVNVGKISLKDLKGEEIQKALEAVFSKLGDDMAQFGVDGLQSFQRVGEGYLETLTRIATNYANLDSILASSSSTFGQTGLASIAARENLIALAGGIDELASKSSSFNDNFLNEADRLAPVQKYVTDQLAAMGLQNLNTRKEFKDYVLGLTTSGALLNTTGDITTRSQQQYVALLDLADAFAKTHAATEDLTKSEQAIADERKDLQSQLDELTMTSAQLLARQRNSLDASNRALFDQIQVATAAKKAQDDARNSLGSLLTQMKSFATSVAGFNNSLVLGNLSALTPEHQLEEARRQFEQTRIAALAGNATAQGALQGIENTFLGLSQKLNGGDSNYLADLAAVMQANDELAQWASGQVDVAQASLDALNKQVDGITQLNATMLTVAQGMQYLPTPENNAAMQAAATPVSPSVDFSAYGTAITAPLIAEIKVLRDELRGLRDDANRQTGDSNNTTIAATQQAAQTIVNGVRQAVTDGAYAANNDTRNPT